MEHNREVANSSKQKQRVKGEAKSTSSRSSEHGEGAGGFLHLLVR